MSDAARYRLEELTPVVAALHKGGYFEKRELKVLVDAWHDFECKLKSTTLSKADWRRYIGHQQKVEQLRQIRQKTRRIKKLAEGEDKLARGGILRHIHFLYSRALHRFKGATDLWEEWIDFCQWSRSNKKLSKVVREGLSYNPTCTSLRLKAAEWEFEHNENPSTARVLFQDGLRKTKGEDSKTLWLHFFKMELRYVQKLRDRQEALEISLSDAAEGAHHMEAESALQEVLEGGVAKIILKNAFAAWPTDLPLRNAFLSTLAEFDASLVEDFEDRICGDLKDGFGKDADAWDIIAKHAFAKAVAQGLPQSEAAGRAFSLYEEGLQHAEHLDIYDYYIPFASQLLENGSLHCESGAQRSTGGSDSVESGFSEMLKSKLHKLCRAVCQGSCASESTLLRWVQLERDMGSLKEALEACKSACGVKPNLPQIWLLRLSIEAQVLQTVDAPAAPLKSVILETLNHMEGSHDVWMASLELMLKSGVIFPEVCERLIDCLRGTMQNLEMGDVAGDFVCGIRQVDGIDSARSFYHKIISNALSLNGSFYKKMIEMERKELASVEAAAGRQRIADMYEGAVLKVGREDPELWVDYAKFEYETGGNYGRVLWRAEKAGHCPRDLDRLWQLKMR